jgi:creatinine amidohydrolase
MVEEIKNLNQYTFSQLVAAKAFSGVDTAIVPLGSLEQHGEHLPFSTDTIIVEYISKIIAGNTNAFLLPSIHYGVSFEHEPFFNVSINHNILLNFISDICISLYKQGINRLYVINGHHGNIGLLQYVGQHISSVYPIKGKFFYFINYWQMLNKSFDHAGEVETSLMLFICPELVRMDLSKKGIDLGKKNGGDDSDCNGEEDVIIKAGINMSINNPGGFIKFTKNGIWGDPSDASAEKGNQMLSRIAEKIVMIIKDGNYK